MKKFITILAILISASAFAQSKQVQPPQLRGYTTFFHVVGTIADFELLYLYLKSPGDVRPNQKAGLIKWVEGLRPIADTIKIKK